MVENREIVAGQTFNWCGMVIQSSGTYTKIYKSIHGCDSTHVLVVTEKEGIEIELTSQQIIPFCDSIQWNGTTYTKSTILIDTLKSLVYGCDSIVTTIFQKGIPFRHHETDTILTGQTILWHGQTISEAGEYYDNHVNRFGCDSTYVLNVVLKASEPQPKVQITRQSICEGDAFTWREKEHTISGTYYDTTFVGTEIDSLFVLYLTVNPTYEQSETVSFSSFPTLYRGETITGPGIYPITYTSSSGCDSIVNVIVNRQAIIHEETATICQGEEYVWRYQHLTEAQTYTETIKGKDGKDSVVYILHLNVHTIPETHITRTICNGDSYVFGTSILTEAGEYSHTFQQDGCDSVVVLSLNIADVDTIVQVHRLNPDESYTWPANGQTYSSAGTYQVTNTNRFGCDSITRLVLTINHVDTIDTVATICPGETLIWHTITASSTGHYENVETSPYGDMYYYRLDLTVRELQEKEIQFFICGDEEVQFNGKTYNAAGHYYDKTACDTLYHIIIDQAPAQVYVTNAALDGMHAYTWTYWENGVENTADFNTPGTYEYTSPNATTGCNDTWRLVLRLDTNSYHFIEDITLCEGEKFSWRGHSDLSLIPGEATYTETLQTRTGQDSIYQLNVTVLPVSRSNQTINFCGTTTFKGIEYSSSTIVYDTLTAANGCDSIVTISLRKIETFYRQDTATIVQGEKLIWHGQTITTDGIYYDKYTNSFGCDSIYELHVGIEAATPQTNMITTIAEICEGDYYEWRGTKYYNNGLYPDTVYATNANERDTIYVLNLTVTEVDRRREQYSFCEGTRLESIYGKDYNNLVSTGEVYRDTVNVPNATHPGCPDIVYIEIYKYPKTHYTETQVLHPGDTLYWHGETITSPRIITHSLSDEGLGGCGIDSTLRVIADEREQYYICQIDTPDLYPFVWHEDTFYTSGIWYDTVFNANGEIEQFYSLDLTITEPYDTAVYLHDCKTHGVVWRDELFLVDTAFIDRVPVEPYNPLNPCDSVFHVNIHIDTVYQVRIDTTLCEYQLPLIIGRVNPDTIWSQGYFEHRSDKTVCDCDSTITGYLTIIPKIDHNDSTFVCSNEIDQNPVILGDTVTPSFLNNDQGNWEGKWEGKWTGVPYTSDTIVWDCDHKYFHHIIVRPSQAVIPEKDFYLCPDDSIQIFWPYDTTWFTHDTIYFEKRPMTSSWVDPLHGNVFNSDTYVCDSTTRWNIKVLPRRDTESTQHILLGDSLFWSGAWRYHTGDFDSVMLATDTNSLGDTCRYIHTLHLIVDTAYIMRDTAEVCELTGKTITHIWNDTHVTQFNTPEKDSTFHVVHTLRSHSTLGLDSIYDLFVDFRRISQTVLYDTICYGDSIQFDSHRFSANENTTTERYLTVAGDYTDTLTAANGCDSIVTIHLYVRDRILTSHHTVHIADTQSPYIWRHTWIGTDGQPIDSIRYLTASGNYSCHMQSIYGCDSIDSLTLYIHPTYYIEDDTINICQNETPYTWRGRDDITTTGDYTYSALTVDGYDSTHVVHINVWPQIYREVFFTTCQGDSILLNGKTYTSPGVYKDTLPTRHGCDSIITIHYDWNDTYLINKTAVTDDKTPYVWVEGNISRTLTHSGTYYDTLQTIHGCDSIIALTLSVYTTHEYYENATACESELPYLWHGKTLWTSGIYYDSLQTAQHYDSVYVLNFSINPSYINDIYYTTCKGDSIQYNGKIYTQPGVYSDTLLTREGCDSVIIIHYDWNDTYLINKTALTDDKTPYIWTEGNISRTLTHSGTYYDTLQTIHGCDSIIALTLTVYPTYLYEEKAIICESETPYAWHGKQYWVSGDYVDSMQTNMHYDSIFILHLTVNDTAYVDYNASICRGESFTFNGKTYNQGGIYLDTLSTLHGCDSIVVIRVKEIPDYFFSDTVSMANRIPCTWRGKTYTHSGVYYDSLQSVVTGCDSIYQLVLTIYDKEQFRDTIIQVCQNDLPYQWKNRWLSQSALFYDTVSNGDVDTIWQVDFRVIEMQHESIEKILCEGDIFTYNGKSYRRDTLVHDTIFSGLGCGTAYTLYLRFRSAREVEYYAQTSSTKPYIWHIEDTTYTFGYAGKYQHVVYTADGKCDSIRYTLHLTVGQAYYYRDSLSLCQSELPYIWHNQMIYDAGIYYDSLQTVMGYDSVYMLKVLQIMPSYFAEQNIDLCSGASAFYYRGKPYSTDGTFYDTIPSISGCDSIFKITVRVHPTYEHYDTVHISDKETYTFDGRILTVPGPYVAYEKTESGCDSIIHLELKVHPSYLFPQKEEICDKDTFIWRGQQLYDTGIYYDSLLSTQGYDSVYKLELTVHSTYYFEESVEVCPNRTTYLHGIDISEPGIYLDTLYSIHGCDSVYKITVNWTRSFRQEYSDTICQGESYNFYGIEYRKTGTYKYEIGCDSTIILHLQVNPRSIETKRVVICDEDLPYIYNGEEYLKTGIYADTMSNHYGCDSIFKLDLIVSEHASPWYQMPLCPGSEIKVGGDTITQAGLYTFLRRSEVSGLMDSLYRIEVYDAPAYDLPTEVRNICRGDTLLFAGKKHWRSGHYDYTLKTTDGCDSIVHMDLTVYPTYQFYTDTTIADYQTYEWRGREYDVQGNYDITFPTINECDSTYTLRLTVLQTQNHITRDTICEGNTYQWRGANYSEDGIYTDTIYLPQRGTSAIYTLDLTVLHPTHITSATIGDVCADTRTFDIGFTYTGAKPTMYSVYFDQLAKDEGFTDVINRQLYGEDRHASIELPSKQEVVYLEHTKYVKPNTYTMSLVLDNGICGNSRVDSILLHIKYPSWIIEQNWNDIVTPLKKEYNGGYEFSLVEWYINGVKQADNGRGYLQASFRENDQVTMRATRKGENYYIETCPLTIHLNPSLAYEDPIIVYPTQAPRHMPVITIESTQGGEYAIYSLTGMMIEGGKLNEGTMQVTLPSVNGIYFIRTKLHEESQIHKVLIY